MRELNGNVSDEHRQQRAVEGDRIVQLRLAGARSQRVRAQAEDVEVACANLPQNRVPPGLTARQLFVHPDMDARAFKISVERLDRRLILAGIADENSHHTNLTLPTRSSPRRQEYVAGPIFQNGTPLSLGFLPRSNAAVKPSPVESGQSPSASHGPEAALTFRCAFSSRRREDPASALLALVPPNEQIVVVEDSRELTPQPSPRGAYGMSAFQGGTRRRDPPSGQDPSPTSGH